MSLINPLASSIEVVSVTKINPIETGFPSKKISSCWAAVVPVLLGVGVISGVEVELEELEFDVLDELDEDLTSSFPSGFSFVLSLFSLEPSFSSFCSCFSLCSSGLVSCF